MMCRCERLSDICKGPGHVLPRLHDSVRQNSLELIATASRCCPMRHGQRQPTHRHTTSTLASDANGVTLANVCHSHHGTALAPCCDALITRYSPARPRWHADTSMCVAGRARGQTRDTHTRCGVHTPPHIASLPQGTQRQLMQPTCGATHTPVVQQGRCARPHLAACLQL